MKNAATLPDISESFAAMKLGFEIDAIHGDSLFVHCLKSDAPVREKIRMIAEQIKDNPALVMDMVGVKVFELVNDYCKKYNV